MKRAKNLIVVNETNLSSIVYENENARLLIYDLVIHHSVIFLFNPSVELTEGMALQMYGALMKSVVAS